MLLVDLNARKKRNKRKNAMPSEVRANVIALDEPSSKWLTDFLAGEEYRQMQRDSPATAQLQHALRVTLAIGLSELRRAMADPSPVTDPPTREDPLVKAWASIDLGRTIATWLFEPESPDRESARSNEIATQLVHHELATFAEAREAMEFWQHKAGRPVTRRHIAVAALDLKLSDSSWSWPKLARRLCERKDCPHGYECEQRIRQEVISLKKFLKSIAM
jgi:hypothetical protein